MKLRSIVPALITVCLALSPALAQVPQQLNYQGRVAVGGVNFNGTGQFKFALVDGGFNLSQQATATAMEFGPGGEITSIIRVSQGFGYVTAPAVTITGAGTGATAVAVMGLGSGTGTGPTDSVYEIQITNAGSGYETATNTVVTIAPPPANIQYQTYWSNDGTSVAGAAPTAAVSLPVTNGLYSVALGDGVLANMTAALSTSVFQNPDVRLRVWFDDGTHGFQLLSPDQKLNAAPYAFIAGTVPTGAITTAQLAVGAVNSAAIASGAVGATQLAPSAISPLALNTGVTAPAPGQVLSFTNDGLRWVNGGGLPLIGSQSLAGPLIDVANTGDGIGIRSISALHDGVNARTDGVFKSGVFGHATGADSSGVHGASDLHHGVYAYTDSNNRAAIWANAPNGAEAIHGHSELNHGVYAHTGSTTNPAIWADAPNGAEAVHAHSELNDGAVGFTNGAGKAGVYGWTNRSDARGGFFGNYNGGEALRTAGRAVIDGNLAVRGTATVRVLTIDNGIDIAEPFMMRKDAEHPRGSVMVISDEREGELQLSQREYDTRVAGIISGANGINPGLQLTQKGFNDVGGQPVALTGRVYCRADASNGAIKPGDLLTTSANPGHAMKASDHSRTQGAVLGKAMSALDEGTGFVLVLVTLQ